MKRHEIEKYAQGLVRWAADFAAVHAAERAKSFASVGNEEAASAWIRVEARILELQGLRVAGLI